MTDLEPDQTPTASEEALRDHIVNRLCSVYDPEIPVNIYDLGLIYRIALQPVPGTGQYDAAIDMTLTSVGCPMADSMPGMVQDCLKDLDALARVDVQLVWDPPWDPSRMSEAARLELDMF